MRRLHSIPALALLLATLAHASGETSALQALKLLPKEAVERVAFIAGFEGKPEPERWHIVVHDPAERTGVHEYVVANGSLVASRSISQFAEELRPSDVLGIDGVKVDTDALSKTAMGYAEANRVGGASLNYELKREGLGAAPLWHVTCLDATGREVGKLIVSAAKGNVLSHNGLPSEPTRMADASDRPKEPVETTATEDGPAPDPNAPAASPGAPGIAAATPKPGGFTRPRNSNSKPAATPAERRNVFQRFFGGGAREPREGRVERNPR